MCESYNFHERTSEWVIGNPLRVHLEVLIERFGLCRCGRPQYCRCKIDPWTDSQAHALTNALRGKQFDPTQILEILKEPELSKELNGAEQNILWEVWRHGMFVRTIMTLTQEPNKFLFTEAGLCCDNGNSVNLGFIESKEHHG